jgi:hypothetical protein
MKDVVLKVKNLFQACNTVSADSSYFPWTVTADNDGHFVTTWTVCNCPGDSLRLRAVGQTSHDTAYVYFSDANFTGTWNSVTPSPSCIGSTASYTLIATTANSNGADFGSGKAVVITFPSGFTLSGITGGTFDGNTIGAISTTATTISFNTPAGVSVNKNKQFTIILNGIINHSTAANYQLSMTIDNSTGTGVGNQDLFPASAASQFAITALPANPSNPTSNSPQCGDIGVTLTRTGSPAGGITWYWQTTPTGTSTVNSGTTFNVTTSGTYYIRAQNNTTLCWSSGAGSLAVTVNPSPADPGNPTSNSPQCADVGVTLTRSGTPPGGETWYWQTTPTGTNTANSGATFNVTTSGTYYIRSQRNSTNCWSSGAGSLAVIVNPLPANPGNPTSNSPQCADVGVTLTRSGTPPAGETWYWQTTPTGTSTANSGATFNVATSGTYYIRSRNNTTLCWSSGAGSLAIVVNPLPADPDDPTSNSPQCTDVGVTLTRTGTPPAGETWYWQTTPTGTSTTNSGTTFNVTTSGTYYVRSQNNTTLCWSSGTGSLAVIVNPLPTNPGNPTSNSPQCADAGVTLTRSGTPPAGITWYWQTTPTGTSTANSGTTFNVTTTGTYYIRAQNNTTLCWSSGAGSLAVVVNPLPAAPSDPTSNSPQCADAGVTLTRSGIPPAGETWYWQTTPTGTNTANSGTTFNVNTSGTYYIRSRNNTTLCWSNGAGSLAVVVNPLPAPPGTPTSNSPQCADAGVTLTRNGTVPAGETWYWQTSATGTTTVNSGVTFNAATSGTYYIRSQNNTTLCWSGAASIAVIVNPNPAAPTGSGTVTVCQSATPATLSVTPPGGSTVDWYDAASGGTLLQAGSNSYQSSTAGTYYAESRNTTTGCKSLTRTAVALVINPNPTIFNVNFTGSLCGTATIILSGSELGVNYQLQRNNSNEGSPVAGTGSPLNFGSFTQNGDYTVIATNATTNCQSNMNGTVNKGGGTEPTKFNVTGGGTFCTGGPGLPVGLGDTETGVNYQLYLDNVAVGSPIAGTGNAISFGNQTGSGTYTVIGTRTNGSGCAATMNGSVQISLDLTAPTITSVTGTTLTLGCNPSASDINAALGTATATDAVSTPTINASDAPATGTCSKSQTRTFTARDACGNTSTAARTVTWTEDTQAPGLNIPGNTTVQCDAVPSVGSATATDNCDGSPTVTYLGETQTAGSCPNSYTLTRKWKAVDACNNSSTAAQTITVVDNTPPAITAPSGTTVTCSGDVPAGITTYSGFCISRRNSK